MFLPFIVFGFLVTFGIQLWLCMSKKPLYVKLLPIVILLVAVLLCCIVSMGAEDAIRAGASLPDQLSYIAAVYSMILFAALVFAAIAWAVYGIASMVTKRIK